MNTQLKIQRNLNKEEVDELLNQDLEVVGLNLSLQPLEESFFEKGFEVKTINKLIKKIKVF